MANLPQHLRDLATALEELAADWETSQTNAQIFTWLKEGATSTERVSIAAVNTYLYDNSLLEDLMAAEATNTKAATLARMLESESAPDIDNTAWSTFVDNLPSAIDAHKTALKALGDSTEQRYVTLKVTLPTISQLNTTRAWVVEGSPA